MKISNLFTTNIRGMIVTIFLTLCIAICGFYDYLFQGQLFFVSAGDTLTQMFPQIVEMHYQLYAGESLMWSFYQGLGAPVAVSHPNYHGDIFAWMLAALPIDFMPSGLIYIHIIKLVCASSLFYVFLSQFNSLSILSKIIGALCYAFSGVMLCRGPWWHYATEVVMVVPVLIGLEKWYRNNNSLYIVVSFALLLISRYATFLYIYSFYVYGYVVFRCIYDGNIQFCNLLRTLVKFSSKYFMSLGLAAIFLLPGIFSYLMSARTGGNIWNNINKAFSIESSEVVLGNILKFYQPNITGIFDTGISNVLEALCGYSGVLILLLCVSICININKFDEYKKKVFILVFMVVFFYITTIFPNFLLNAFVINRIKLSSIWLNIVLITIGVYALKRVNYKIFLCAGIVLLLAFGITIWMYNATMLPIVKEEVYCAVIFLIVYMILLCMYSVRKKENYLYVVLGVIVIELCISCRFSGIQIDYMQLLSNKNVWEELYHKHDKLGKLYESEFFRVAVSRKNGVLESDSSINRYYGFDRYNSVNSRMLVDFTDMFFNNMGMGKAHHMHGLSDYRGIRNMFSSKYLCDDVTENVVLNRNYVELGYLYDYYIDASELEHYPSNVRDDVISKAAILNDNVKGIKKYSDTFNIEEIASYPLKKLYSNDLQMLTEGVYKVSGNDPFIVYEIPEEFEVQKGIHSMEVNINVKRNDTSTSNIKDLNYQIYFGDENKNFSVNKSFFTSIRNGKSSPYLPDYMEGSKFLRLDVGAKGQVVEITNVDLSVWDVKNGNAQIEYIPYVPLDKNSVCETVSFSPTEIHLKANINDPRILFLSIPYDRGWSIYDNGKEIEVMHVNIGFMGAYLEPGEHNLVVKYRTPGLYEGAAISGITAIALLIMWIRRRRNGVA